MQYRFAAFDLDGTLLNDKKELTPKTRAALAQLQARGVRLILASGRHPKGVLPLGGFFQRLVWIADRAMNSSFPAYFSGCFYFRPSV